MKSILFLSSASGAIKYFSELAKFLDRFYNIFFVVSYAARDFATGGSENIFIFDEDVYNQDSDYANKIKNEIFKNIHFDLLIIARGWKSLIDIDIARCSKANGIKVINIIESWYVERFFYGVNTTNLHFDYILLNDSLSKANCVAFGVAEDIIFTFGNPVLEKRWQDKDIKQLDLIYQKMSGSIKGRKILFLSEDYSRAFPKDSEHHQGFDEFDVINDILENIVSDDMLYIKLHPMEEKNKYSYLLNNANITIVEQDKLDALALNVDLVIGMGTILLLEIALKRNDVISYRPKDRKGFIGNDIGATKLISAKAELGKVINSEIKIHNSGFKNSFEGSTQRIVDFIMEKI